MEITPLTTGTVRLKDAFLHARSGPMRQPALFLPGRFSRPMPIHAWLVEHDGRRILVDTGETADVHDLPFVKSTVGEADELPRVLAAAGTSLAEVDTVVLTHLHGDHMDGAVHVDGPVLVHRAELEHALRPSTRAIARAMRQPVPAGVDLQAIDPASADRLARRVTQ